MFPAGARPWAAEIHEICAASASLSVSHNPHDGDAESGKKSAEWLEILCDGLTFELSGLGHGECRVLEEFDAASGTIPDSIPASSQAVLLAPGPHLSGGESSMPIVRTMMALAASFAELLPALSGFYWPPAHYVSGKTNFTRKVDNWLAGGPFPVPELISCQFDARGSLRSQGLAHFTGQELVLEPAISADRNAALQLAARLLGQILLQGRIEAADSITGPDGNPLGIDLSPDRTEILVRRG
ncbi:MAG: hypothetical protein WAT93_07210 [Pontixanthobacter sp.]